MQGRMRRKTATMGKFNFITGVILWKLKLARTRFHRFASPPPPPVFVVDPSTHRESISRRQQEVDEKGRSAVVDRQLDEWRGEEKKYPVEQLFPYMSMTPAIR